MVLTPWRQGFTSLKPTMQMRLALTSFSSCLCLPTMMGLQVSAISLSHNFYQVSIMSLCPSSSKFGILISHHVLKQYFSDHWIFKSKVILDGCTPSPQDFGYLLDDRMNHKPWKLYLPEGMEVSNVAASLHLISKWTLRFRVNCTIDLEPLLIEVRSAM